MARDPLLEEFDDHVRYHGIIFNFEIRTSFIRRYTCSFRDSTGCSCRLWIWNDGRVIPIEWHSGHPGAADSPSNASSSEAGSRNLEDSRNSSSTSENQMAIHSTQDPGGRGRGRSRGRGRGRGGTPRFEQLRSPKTLFQLAAMLIDWETNTDIYRGSVNGADHRSRAFMFADSNVLQNIDNEQVLYIDTSTRFVPRTPRLSHSLVILTRHERNTIPIMICLCTDRSSDLYAAILEFLVSRAPLLRSNLQSIVTIMDRGLVRSIRATFPLCQIRSSWMQMMRDFTRYWCSNGLPFRLNDETLRLSWALPVVPRSFRLDALAEITVASHEIENDYPAVVLFARHVERMTLLILRDQLITRNITEEFMQSLIRRCPKGSLSLANVLAQIRNVIETGARGFPGVRVANDDDDQDTYRNNIRIYNLQRLLVDGNITPRQFMDRVIDVYQRDMISLAVQEEVRHPIEIPRFEDLQTRGRMEASGPSIVRRQPELSVNRHDLELVRGPSSGQSSSRARVSDHETRHTESVAITSVTETVSMRSHSSEEEQFPMEEQDADLALLLSSEDVIEGLNLERARGPSSGLGLSRSRASDHETRHTERVGVTPVAETLPMRSRSSEEERFPFDEEDADLSMMLSSDDVIDGLNLEHARGLSSGLGSSRFRASDHETRHTERVGVTPVAETLPMRSRSSEERFPIDEEDADLSMMLPSNDVIEGLSLEHACGLSSGLGSSRSRASDHETRHTERVGITSVAETLPRRNLSPKEGQRNENDEHADEMSPLLPHQDVIDGHDQEDPNGPSSGQGLCEVIGNGDTPHVNSSSQRSAPISNLEQDTRCINCLDNPPVAAFVNCGHLCVCTECLMVLFRHGPFEKCPICRKESGKCIKIFY